MKQKIFAIQCLKKKLRVSKGNIMKILTQSEIAIIEKSIGYTFLDKALLEKAFTHSSIANLYNIESNERLEFFGDSVLSLIVSEELYNNLDADEGKLSHIRAQIVSAQNLAGIVDALKLTQIYEKYTKCELSVNVKGDLFESLLGAIYIDGGLDVAKRFVDNNIDLSAQGVTKQKDNDFKSPLQTYLQGCGITEFKYATLSQTGQAHKPLFEVGLYIDKSLICTAKAGSKQKAEQQCAEKALKLLPSHFFEHSDDDNNEKQNV